MKQVFHILVQISLKIIMQLLQVLQLTGSLNFPFSGSGLFSSLLTGSYSYFNAFKSSIFGTTIENNLSVPVSFDNRISVTTVALGLQVSPAVSPKISPFLNANLGLNILSISLSRNDATSVIFSDAVRLDNYKCRIDI